MECLTLKNSLDHWAQRWRCILCLEASYTWSSPGVCLFLFNIIINDSEDETLIGFANDTNHEGAVGTLSSGDLAAERGCTQGPPGLALGRHGRSHQPIEPLSSILKFMLMPRLYPNSGQTDFSVVLPCCH